MFSLYFNEKRQAFTIIQSGVTVTEFYDGTSILMSENVDELRGIAKGIMFARYCESPYYTVEALAKAMLAEVHVKEKTD